MPLLTFFSYLSLFFIVFQIKRLRTEGTLGQPKKKRFFINGKLVSRRFGKWAEMKSSSGKIYYFDIDTQKSTWTKPSEFSDLEREDLRRQRAAAQAHQRKMVPTLQPAPVQPPQPFPHSRQPGHAPGMSIADRIAGATGRGEREQPTPPPSSGEEAASSRLTRPPSPPSPHPDDPVHKGNFTDEEEDEEDGGALALIANAARKKNNGSSGGGSMGFQMKIKVFFIYSIITS